jgi:hypothetical protein
MIYKIGRGYHLYRAEIQGQIRGGLMVVDTDGYTGGGPTSVLASEIMGQCRTFEFTGIVLDTLRENAPLLRSLAEHLASAAKRGGLHLYVPESLADIDDSVSVIITSAVSGGTLLQRLSDGAARYGKERLALEIERLRMDFLLPARSGCGTVLTAEELKELMEKHRARTFFSHELAANYFYYRAENNAHFVLFDNGASIRHKLSLAEKMGIETIFLYYPQVMDVLEEIIAK